MLKLALPVLLRLFADLCEGRVPIPRQCPDCAARDTLVVHDYKQRFCHLAVNAL